MHERKLICNAKRGDILWRRNECFVSIEDKKDHVVGTDVVLDEYNYEPTRRGGTVSRQRTRKQLVPSTVP